VFVVGRTKGGMPMLLENELVEMVWAYPNRAKYESCGYHFTKPGDKFWAKAIDVLKCSSGAKIPVQCDYCGKVYYPTSRNYEKKRKHSNKDCCVSCKGQESKETNQIKYGVDNVMQVQEFKEKHQETCMEKFGTLSPLESKEIFAKTQNTLYEKYGVKSIGEIWTNDAIYQKLVETNTKKFGGVSPFCSTKIRRKIRQTFFQNGTCATSQKQIDLCEMLKKIYGNCLLNYPCDLTSLDCMVEINNIKFDIEYDGWYWHKDRAEEDRRRNFFVGKQGYKIIRFLAYKDRLPTRDEITKAVDYLLTTNNKFIRIDLS